jgi:hypothetical protein
LPMSLPVYLAVLSVPVYSALSILLNGCIENATWHYFFRNFVNGYLKYFQFVFSIYSF